MEFESKKDRAENIVATETSWSDLRNGDLLPYRADYGGINEDFEFLIEGDDNGRLRLRHVGYWMEALFGASLAGRELFSLFAETHQRQVLAKTEELLNEPAKVYIDSVANEQKIEIGLFPVSADFGPVNYAIGSISLNACPTERITSLGLRHVETESLRAKRSALKYGFAEDRVGFQGARAMPFKVIDGGGQGNSRKSANFQVIQHIKREP